MKCSVFQYPYEKVLRRTKGVLPKLKMRIVNFDSVKGNIRATSSFSFLKPTVQVDLLLEKMEDHHTRVTVRSLIVKKLFFQRKEDPETSEAAVLDAISSVI